MLASIVGLVVVAAACSGGSTTRTVQPLRGHTFHSSGLARGFIATSREHSPDQHGPGVVSCVEHDNRWRKQMMYAGSGWGAWVAGGLMMVAFWALVFWVIVSLVRRPAETTPRTRTAEEILAERFARGELDDDGYQQRRRALQMH
jgi:putative membrane protein